MGDQLVARLLPINAYTHQTSMPCVRFEPTIPASERANAVYSFDRSITLTDRTNVVFLKKKVFIVQQIGEPT
jgi:hypothetical protein